MNSLVHKGNLFWGSIRLLIILGITIIAIRALFAVDRCTFIGRYGSPLVAAILIPSFLVAGLYFLRRRPWWATLRITLGTAAVALVLWFFLGPEVYPVPQRAMAAVAMEDMRQIARQLEAGVTLSEVTDPWCHPYEIQSSRSGFVVISYGQGGKRDIPLGHSYPQGPTHSYEDDIVFSAGHFTRYPDGLSP